MEHEKGEDFEKPILADTVWHSIIRECPACGEKLLVVYSYDIRDIRVSHYPKEKDV